MMILNTDSIPTADEPSFISYDIRPPLGDILSFRPVSRARRRMTHVGLKDGNDERRESGELDAVNNLTAIMSTVVLKDNRLKIATA